MEARPRRIIHASSGAIYGRRGQDLSCLDETATVEPETVYAVTKSASERLALRLAALAQLDLISVRLPPQFGPMERETSGRTRLSPLYSWCVAAVQNRELIVHRAQKARDYTYVTDVAETIYRLAVAPRLNHHVYNISSGVPVGNSEIISTLRDLVPGLRVRYVDSDGEDLTYRSPFNVRRLTDELGWLPQCDLRATLSAYLAWLKLSGRSRD